MTNPVSHTGHLPMEVLDKQACFWGQGGQIPPSCCYEIGRQMQASIFGRVSSDSRSEPSPVQIFIHTHHKKKTTRHDSNERRPERKGLFCVWLMLSVQAVGGTRQPAGAGGKICSWVEMGASKTRVLLEGYIFLFMYWRPPNLKQASSLFHQSQAPLQPCCVRARSQLQYNSTG